MILASAGAGKSQHIAERALEISGQGKNVLLVTYTINNQVELLKHICRLNRYKPSNITIKGWFTFLLEDMVRPYQRCIAPQRVSGIVLDSSDPHVVNGRPVRGEKKGAGYNLRYFLTTELNAHTAYLSKFATRIHQESQGKAAQRVAAIYAGIFIDEVQDLVGWDFDIVQTLATAAIPTITCVGDFRQTIYRTSVARKNPAKRDQKIAKLKDLGFAIRYMNENRRSLQSLCDFADLVHSNDQTFSKTKSLVGSIPEHFRDHQGVFAIRSKDVLEYISRYRPVLLRWNRLTAPGLCENRVAFNFGEAKGMGFDRVLVLPTERYRRFLRGQGDAFDDDSNDDVRNKLYVAITRARYSVAFLVDSADPVLPGIHLWRP